MTLEVRDIEYVRYQSSAIVLGLSLTRAPDELETELIQAWPSVEGTDRPLRVEGRLLIAEVPSTVAAKACVAWLMSDQGLAAMAARATVVADASEQLFTDLQALVHSTYDAGPVG